MGKDVKEVKTVTAGFIFSWIFGVLFLFAGLGNLMSGAYISSLIIILCALLIIPYFNNIMTEKLHFRISGGIKFLLVIIIFVVVGISVSKSSQTTPNSSADPVIVNPTESNTIPQPKLPPQITYLNKNYNDLWNIFSPQSKYTDLQKKKIFADEYKDRYVKWTGRVMEVDASILDNLRLYVEHRNKGDFDYYGGDMVIYMQKDQYDNLLKLKKGDQVTYSAKFNGFGELISVAFTLDEGKIVN